MKPYLLAADSTVVLERAIFQLAGPDAQRYLNGQVSQDVALASDSEAVYACITNFKGKMDGDCYIRRYQNALLIDCPLELRDALFSRLDRYIIADDAELTDLTDSLSIVHTLAPSSHPSGAASCLRFGQAGCDQILPAAEAAAVTASTTLEECEKVRISHGIPRWGYELDHDTLPPEAGLEERAISYTKGCYTGQEVISRIRSAGKTNRHLVSLSLSGPAPLQSSLLCEGATPEKPAGQLTSLCCIDGAHLALAYRKRKFAEIADFHCGSATATVVHR